jgi:type VII secretion protein EccB
MQSQRDQVQAHQFVMGRLTSGIMRVEPDAVRSPTSRTLRGSVGGLVLAGLIAAGGLVYGLVKPGGNAAWAKNGTLVVVKDTGADFIFLGGALHPVLNETSAKLLAGDQMTVADVSSSSLAGAPVGAPVGIVGAPAELPPASALTAAPWLACVTGPSADSTSSTPTLTLAVGEGSGGSTQAPGTQLTADQGLLVQTPDGTDYLLWQGERLRVATSDGVLAALGYTSTTPYPVSATFINTLSAGPDLAPLPVAGLGAAGPELSEQPTKYGQLFTGLAGTHYVLTEAGLEPLTPLQYALLLGDPAIQAQAYGGRTVAVGTVGAQDLQQHLVAAVPGALPEQPPTPVSVGSAQELCAETIVTGAQPAFAVGLLPAGSVVGTAPALEPGDQAACAGADYIDVPPGRAALVRGMSGGDNGLTEYLVTDDGVKYPMPSAVIAVALGYTSPVVPVPTSLLTLLPTGPSLDPTLVASGAIAQPQASGPADCGQAPAAGTPSAAASQRQGTEQS